MNNLEAVRDAIIKAVPEIVELKFGCELVQQSITFLVVGTTPNGEPITVKKTGAFDASKAPGANVEKFQGKTEILGRPIRLADVMLALWKKTPANRTLINLECSGQIRIQQHTAGSTWSLGPDWNLYKDDLSQQSEECIDFLHSILCV